MKPFDENMRQVCREAWHHFGVDAQIVKAMEEAGELVQALSKLYQARNASQPDDKELSQATEHLMEELADVMIMVCQFVEWDVGAFNIVLTKKLNGLVKRMGVPHG